MSWSTVTADDVLRVLSAPESDVMQSAAMEDGQANPLDGIIADTVREARARIAAFRTNRLEPGDTIPPDVKAPVLAMIRYRLLSRLPVGDLITDARRKEYEDALAFMRDVAAGRVAVEQPPAGDIDTTPRQTTPTPVVRGREPRFSRSQQDGI